MLIVTVLLNIDTAREYWNYHFFYASNFLYAYKGGFDRLSHFWSLAVEEQFYLFWPILILAIPLKWRNFNFFLLVSLISLLFKIVLAIFLTANNNIVYFLMPSCIESFSFGAAVLMLNKEDISFKKINIVLACSLLVFVLLLFGANSPNYFISFIGKVLGRTVLSVFFAFVLLLIKNGHLSVFFSRMLTLKPVLLLGKISYGIYVYHMFIPSLLVFLQRKFHFDLSGSGFYLLLDFVITFGLSYISYFIFELPINNLKKKFPY